MRLGLFGGSFDPVHLGHLELARCCAEQAALDEVWFVPAAHQPLKPGGPQATNDQRLAMLQVAIADQHDMKTSSIEIERGGVSYTIETLQEVRRQMPDAELFFLMGADSLADLPHWRHPQQICQLCTLLVVRRAGSAEPDFDVLADFVSKDRLREMRDMQVEMPPTPISSSEIRSLVGSQGEWQQMVPERVASYITGNRLYET